MAIVIPNGSEQRLLDVLNSAWTPVIKLYTTDVVLDEDTTALSFGGLEASFPGYASQTLTFPNPAADDGTGRAYIDSDEMVWTVSASGSPQDIYGFVITDATDTMLFAARDPNAPVTLDTEDQTYKVTVRFRLKEEV